MGTIAWLKLATVVGLACLPVMRHWKTDTHQKPRRPKYLAAWVNGRWFYSNMKQR